MKLVLSKSKINEINERLLIERIKDVLSDFGYSLQATRKAYKNSTGLTPQQFKDKHKTVSLEQSRINKAIAIYADGKSIREVSKETGITRTSVTNLLIILGLHEVKINESINFRGNTFRTIRDFAKYHNKKESLVYDRIRRGWSAEEALGLVDRKRPNANAFKFNGEIYNSQSDLAEAHGIKLGTFRRRAFKAEPRWSWEQALELEKPPLANTGIALEVNGEIFNTIADAAKKFGIKRETFNARLNKGLTGDDLISIKNLSNKAITVEGVLYESVSAACMKYEVMQSVINQRLRSGWTTNQAFNIPLNKEPENGYNCYIYSYKNKVNGKIYIGQTRQSIETRQWDHMKKVKSKDYSLGSIHAAIDEFGLENFTFEVVETVNHPSKLDKRELYWIEYYSSFYTGYNLKKGNSGSGSSHGTPFFVHSKRFVSQSEAARYYCIKPMTFNARIRLGWTPEEAAQTKVVVFRGKEYKNHKELARAHGVRYGQFHQRISGDNPWSLEQALEIKQVPKRNANNNKQVVINGLVLYHSHSEAEKALDLPSISERLKRGWNIKQAIGMEQPPKRLSPNESGITIHGVKYSSVNSAAKEYGINCETLRFRLKSGLTPEKAIHCRSLSKVKVTCEGVIYKSLAELARVFDMKESLVWYRITKGKWTPEQAVGLENEPKNKYKTPKNAVKLVIRFKEFSSVQDACDHFGISVSKYYYQRKKGKTPEEIFKVVRKV
jgi:group I intron endonuclease